MKKSPNLIRLFAFLIVLCLGLTNLSYGQSLPRLPKKIKRKINERLERKVERKVEEKVDDAIDEALDKVLDPDSPSTKKKDKNSNEEKDKTVKTDGDEVILEDETGDISVSVETDDTEPTEVVKSDFTGSFVMEVKEYKNGKMAKDFPAEISYFIDEYRIAFEPKNNDRKEQVIIIYDRQNRKITNKITDKEGKKTAMIMPMMKIKLGISKKDADKYEVSKTGKTKIILGYSCEQYIVEGPDEVSTVWVTDEISYQMTGLADMVYVKDPSGNATNWSNIYGIEGMPLETRSESRNGKIVRESKMTSLKVGELDDAIFSLEGYEVSDMAKMMGRE